jgi:outer membrane protein assembly factor BamB
MWQLAYAAPGDMPYTNSPRATPVVHDGMVYLLGAFGHLHCVRADSGKLIWKKDLMKDFGATLPTWGMTATPLIVDETLIVNPGAKDASLAALDRHTGAIVWKAPGAASAYASFLVTDFRGQRQIVGYDAESLGGWNAATGERVWRVVPEKEGDYNVPTPIAIQDRLFVSTENNSSRLYGFTGKGYPTYIRRPQRAHFTNPPSRVGPSRGAPRVSNCEAFCFSRSWFARYCCQVI